MASKVARRRWQGSVSRSETGSHTRVPAACCATQSAMWPALWPGFQVATAHGRIEEEVANGDARALEAPASADRNGPRARRGAKPRPRPRDDLGALIAAMRRASPRKPSVRAAARSRASRILLVAWRWRAKHRIVTLHAFAIIHHGDRAASPFFHGDGDTAGPGIDAILQELLHHGDGALDDLAGGDLADSRLIQDRDAAHGDPPSRREYSRQRATRQAGARRVGAEPQLPGTPSLCYNKPQCSC